MVHLLVSYLFRTTPLIRMCFCLISSLLQHQGLEEYWCHMTISTNIYLLTNGGLNDPVTHSS